MTLLSHDRNTRSTSSSVCASESSSDWRIALATPIVCAGAVEWTQKKPFCPTAISNGIDCPMQLKTGQSLVNSLSTKQCVMGCAKEDWLQCVPLSQRQVALAAETPLQFAKCGFTGHPILLGPTSHFHRSLHNVTPQLSGTVFKKETHLRS
jgi:hypothetical protein